MSRFLALLSFSLFLSLSSNCQTIDSLKLTEKEIPENYVLTKENNCISIQACTFYESPDMYSALIGNIKSKQIQNFEGKKDKGAIMYFEFEDNFKGEGFLEGLLWGGSKPTKEHPEEYYSKGKFLVIWSFKKGSPLALASKNKIKAILK